MKYHKINKLLDDTTNQTFIFTTRNCVDVNDESRRTYSANSDIKFRTSLISSNLYYAYVHFQGTIIVPNISGAGEAVNITKTG